MQIEPLFKLSLIGYNIRVKEIDTQFDLFDYFLQTITKMIDSGNDLYSVFPSLDYERHVEFESEETVIGLEFLLYNFFNDSISLIEFLGQPDNYYMHERIILDLFNEFCEINNRNFNEIALIINKYCDRLTCVISDLIGFDELDNSEINLKDRFGKNLTFHIINFYYLFLDQEQSEINKPRYLSELFSSLLNLIILLNIDRKKVLFKHYKMNYNYSKIDENDPCPCGSGNKYKICCMLRMN